MEEKRRIKKHRRIRAIPARGPLLNRGGARGKLSPSGEAIAWRSAVRCPTARWPPAGRRRVTPVENTRYPRTAIARCSALLNSAVLSFIE